MIVNSSVHTLLIRSYCGVKPRLQYKHEYQEEGHRKRIAHMSYLFGESRVVQPRFEQLAPILVEPNKSSVARYQSVDERAYQ